MARSKTKVNSDTTAAAADDAVAEIPDPQVVESPRRRHFTPEFKLQVLVEADQCTEFGAIGALLRRYGLYSSHLTTWRRERDAGALAQLGKKRGRKPRDQNPLAPRLVQLERENARLQHRLKQAETIIEVQKKVSELLGIPLNPAAKGEAD